MFASRALGLKSLKNIGSKWRQIVTLPEASACLGPAFSPILNSVASVLCWRQVELNAMLNVSCKLPVTKALIANCVPVMS